MFCDLDYLFHLHAHPNIPKACSTLCFTFLSPFSSNEDAKDNLRNDQQGRNKHAALFWCGDEAGYLDMTTVVRLQEQYVLIDTEPDCEESCLGLVHSLFNVFKRRGWLVRISQTKVASSASHEMMHILACEGIDVVH
ncbi:hypothetical protein M3J09_005659 [Ascochyta lentis]